PYQWLDSLLARHEVVGVASETQGVRRTVSDEAMVTLAIVRDLTHELGIPTARAIRVAESATSDGRYRAGTVTLHLDRAAVARRLAPHVADAVERVVPRRRGRPPRP
nr:hypothetical protein [Gemmatimonadaceae bacterium]